MNQASNRRGFIKGIIAGLAGAFFALRGAEPVDAATTSLPLQEIRMPLPLLDVLPPLSAADKARLEYLELHLDVISDEEKEEWVALSRERDRLTQLGSVNGTKAMITAYERAEVRRGQFSVINFALKQSGEAISWTQTVSRKRNGEMPELVLARISYSELVKFYEDRYGPYPGS